MTARVRLFLAWLVMAAIPLQGLAAVSMPACHAAIHDLEANAVHLASAHHHGVHPDAPAPGAASASPDVDGVCAICASCCHSVAISELPSVEMAAALPPSRLTGPPEAMDSAHPQVPHRPPRS